MNEGRWVREDGELFWDPDPLTVEEPAALEPVQRRSRAVPLAIAACAFLLGFVFGVSLVRAAPRPAHLSAIPVVDDGRTGASPVGYWSEPTLRRMAPGSTPGDRAEVAPLGAPLSGIASWYPARGLIAAAGPGLRHGNWRGSHLVVSANGRAVTVELSDWCLCPHGRLIDLSDDAFARLAPLSRGLVRVSISGVGPMPTPPATDR